MSEHQGALTWTNKSHTQNKQKKKTFERFTKDF